MFKFLRVGWFPLHRPYSAFLTATVPSKLAPWKGERVKPRPISVSEKKRGSKGFLPVLKCLILKRNFWAYLTGSHFGSSQVPWEGLTSKTMETHLGKMFILI